MLRRSRSPNLPAHLRAGAALVAMLALGLSACPEPTDAPPTVALPMPAPKNQSPETKPDREPPSLRGDNRGDRIVGAPWATRSPVLGRHGMAATSHPLATKTAIDVLEDGGSAVDAAIAANAVLGLVEPTGCGIGGDLFAIVWDPTTAKLHGLNASGRSPRGQSLAQLRTRIGDAEEMPNWGSVSVTVPGAVDGWFQLHGKFGRLPMSELLAPAVRHAREGVPVTQLIAYYMQRSQESFERLHGEGVIEEIENYRNTYLIAGAAPREGQVFANPDLAETYSLLGRNGQKAFYDGELTETMARYFARIGAPLSADDFATHESQWVDPVSVEYRGHTLHELPPNGQGVAALQMLRLLEAHDLAAMGHNSVDSLHVMVEAKKLAFEDRARFYADPEFHQFDVSRLLSDEYTKDRVQRIDRTTAARSVDHGPEGLLEGDTIYLTVADERGMMVSLIQSNYRGMGSGLVPDGLGFMLQDRGALFALDESHPNAYAPGKRPFHTIIPAFVTKDGRPFMSFGVMGGAMQPQGHVQILVNIVDFGMNVQEAGDAARFHHKGSTEPTWVGRMDDGGVLELESGIRAEVVDALRQRGHEVEITSGPFGGYQAIMRDPETGVYWGASEMRKDGLALGY